ncbi:TonB-dependent receptor [Gluconacetobacter aggeris]|uniref:TonB-dependent receptor n=1 Tax=Gluconacetobacter aggeris TaxID=1286186 RepID=A0A7W4IWA6_9PROT|nr:TonB-dependent receptor [Gluconacetobacter aggeris]MBB2170196.1 TonB-dependent receptor [Gluconacetobacter aggeris]
MVCSPVFAQGTMTATQTPRKHIKPTKATKKTVAPTTATAPVTTRPAVMAPNAAIVAQTSTAPVVPTSAEAENVVVTGSLIRDPNFRSASPMTHLTSRDLRQRGITTASQALQQLASNGSGNLPANFSANGAFAAGATAPSLRGLTTDSTLVLMDGQRLSYYPLSDDGERNFVDSNWIPMSIMETIDVQKDSASATYGADAVAGVINFITRKQIKGFEANAEGGLSGQGDSGHQRLYATYGHGDLDRDGYNFYVNAEYQNDDMLYNSQRGYPYNTGDLTGIGGYNANPNAVQADGSVTGIGATTTALVRPVSVGSSGALTPLGGLQPLGGCGDLTAHNVPVGAFPGSTGKFANSICEQNTVGNYKVITPADRRVSTTAHFTVRPWQRAELTGMFTYSQNLNYNTATPISIRSQSRSGDISFANITLPALLANGQLNPNNPYAAQGQAAQIYYLFGDMRPTSTQFNQAYRGSVHLSGWEPSNWGSDWKYNASFVGMTDDLAYVRTGYPIFNRVQQAINDGSYNFINPSMNSAAIRNWIAPRSTQHSDSSEYSGELTLQKGLFKLPGGMVNLVVGGNIRYESLNNPSANPDDPLNPSAQYMGINGFYAKGSRWVESGFFETYIPFVKYFSADVSGRYDNYSVGYNRFSPKVEALIKPIKEFTLRGTFSKGFRVPSFAETNSQTVGYVTDNPSSHSYTSAFLAQHQNAAGTGPDAYAQSYSLALNTVGNPNVKPELSTSFTGGAVIQPTRWMNLSVDYYYIKKDNYITTANQATALEAYYTGSPMPSGISVIPDVADPDHPNAQPRAGIVNLGYINGASLTTDGLDLALDANIPLPGKLSKIKWYSKGEATYIFRYNITYPGVGTERFAGTLGPANTTSASGTPRWRANWANTFTYDKLSLTTTVYYTSGYKLTAEDYNGPGTRNDCSTAATGFAGETTLDGNPIRCNAPSFWDVDLTLAYRISNRFSVYANMYNVGNWKPALDLGTYGGYLYNPSWAAAGMLGRAFRFGVNVTL